MRITDMFNKTIIIYDCFWKRKKCWVIQQGLFASFCEVYTDVRKQYMLWQKWIPAERRFVSACWISFGHSSGLGCTFIKLLSSSFFHMMSRWGHVSMNSCFFFFFDKFPDCAVSGGSVRRFQISIYNWQIPFRHVYSNGFSEGDSNIVISFGGTFTLRLL